MTTVPGVDRVREYHDSTKHHFGRFARSSGYLDWATQPDAFRRFAGAALVDLVEPLERAVATRPRSTVPWFAVDYRELADRPDQIRLSPGIEAVSVLLRYSLGLSAWKQVGGARWALRVNPSSGNLHPTEGYVVLPGGVAGDESGVFHYRPDIHALERRCALPQGVWDALVAGSPPGSFLAGLTSIHWREAWKYGERAFRYCQHDTGHAIAAVRMAAAMLGWHVRVIPGWPSAAMSQLLGLDRDADFEGAEREDPECLLLLSPARAEGTAAAPGGTAVEHLQAASWHGRANALSPARVDWEAIDEVAAATRIEAASWSSPPALASVTTPTCRAETTTSGTPASRLFLQRRSAVAMSGRGEMSFDAFAALLRRLMPADCAPWDALWWRPRIHLALFVHRVAGLEPGLYALARSAAAVPLLQRSFREDFAWVRPAGVAEDLPFFLLVPMDVRRVSVQLSCGQAITADGFFSLGMLAEFEEALAERGPSFYRNLFWEAGTIGQMLYLEAEAAGARGTGIGCYFDDPVHELLGITGHDLQSLYHFTVGQPVDDARLQTEPGYAWEKGVDATRS